MFKNNKKTRKVYPYSMVLNTVNNHGPIQTRDVSEILNMRSVEAQRWLNKARNERYVEVCPRYNIYKASAVYEIPFEQINDKKTYISHY
jgi:hypothetical protein